VAQGFQARPRAGYRRPSKPPPAPPKAWVLAAVAISRARWQASQAAAVEEGSGPSPPGPCLTLDIRRLG